MNKLRRLYKNNLIGIGHKKNPDFKGFHIYNLQFFTLTLAYVILQLLEILILVGGHFLPLFSDGKILFTEDGVNL